MTKSRSYVPRWIAAARLTAGRAIHLADPGSLAKGLLSRCAGHFENGEKAEIVAYDGGRLALLDGHKPPSRTRTWPKFPSKAARPEPSTYLVSRIAIYDRLFLN